MKTSLSPFRRFTILMAVVAVFGPASTALADTIGDQTTTLYTSNTTPPNTFTGTISVSTAPAVVVSNSGDVGLTINSGAVLTSGGASGTLSLDVNTDVTSLTVTNAGTISNTGTGNAIDLTPTRGDGTYVTATVINTGLIEGNVALGGGNNSYDSSGGTLSGNLTAAGGNNQVSLSTSALISGSVSLGNGNNALTIDNSTVNGSVTTGSGNDTMSVQTGGLVNGNINLGAGTNSLTLDDGDVSGTITGGTGDDTLNIKATSVVHGNVNLGAGTNTITLNNGTISGTLTTAGGDDVFTSTAGGLVTGAINLGDGANTVTLTSSTVTGGVTTGSGNDNLAVVSSTLGGTVDLGSGANTVQVSHTTFTASLLTGAGNDVINISNSTLVSASVSVGDGANTVTIEQSSGAAALTAGDGGTTFVVSASTLTGNISAGAGDDVVRALNTSTLSGTVALGDGTNAVIVSDSTLTGGISGGTGADTISLTNATMTGDMSLGAGNNVIGMFNSTLTGSATTTTGDDTFDLVNSILGGNVSLGLGTNTVTLSNSTISGTLSGDNGADSVTLTNSTVSGTVGLGNGTNSLTLNGTSRVNGNLTTGTGADTITLNGTSYISGSLIDGGGSGDILSINTTGAYTPAGSISGYEIISVTAPAFNIVSNVTGVDTLRIGSAATVNVSEDLILNSGGAILSSGTLHIGAGTTVSAATANLAGSLLSVDIAPIVSNGQLVLTSGGLTGGTSVTINMVSHTTSFIANGTSFTLVDAAGTTSGMTLTSSTYGLLYTYNLSTPNGQDVVLTVSRSVIPYASTTNATAVAAALDAQSATVSGSMAQLQTLMENATTASELNSLVESTAPSLNTMGVTALTLDRASTRQITNRLASLRGTGLEGVAAGDTGEQTQLWLQGFANGLTRDSDATSYGYTGNSHGFVLGMDSAYFDGGTTGLALSYGTGSVKSKAPGGATNDVNSLTANLYGSTVLENGVFISGLGGLGYDTYSTQRNVTGLGTATGSTSGFHATAKVESGIDLPMWDVVTLTPVVGAQYSYATMDAYTEEGLGNAGLTVTPDTMSTLDLSAGMELKTYIPVGEFTYLRPSLRAVFTHRLGDDSLSGKARFISGGPSFATVGTSEGPNIITLGGGLGLLSLDGADFSLTYDAELRDAMFGYSAQMKAKMPF